MNNKSGRGMGKGVAVLLLWIAAVPAMGEEAMSQAATDFMESLASEQQTLTSYGLDAEERTRWHFVPNEMFPREGLALKAMTPAQRERAMALLASGLSQSGFLTATAIMELEKVLNVLESGGRFVRDAENYRIWVFGTPTTDGTWGWRFEGHHVSLNFTVVMGQLTVSTPTFLGSNPAEVREGWQTEAQRGQRVLAAQEDRGRALVRSLDESQRSAALLPGNAPNDIVTGNQFPVSALSPVGLPAAAMTGDQQGLLRELINAYTDVVAEDIAALRWQKIQADGFDNISFAWAGPLEPGAPHYYRVQGPSFLIEYDNVQNGANHIHAVWRDFAGDFGRDLLQEHRAAVAHQ